MEQSKEGLAYLKEGKEIEECVWPIETGSTK
jgi:hypothetical protein